MDANLIIDDDYVQTVGSLCSRRGRELEEILEEYSAILDEIQQEALMEGDISFPECVQRMCLFAERTAGENFSAGRLCL